MTVVDKIDKVVKVFGGVSEKSIKVDIVESQEFKKPRIKDMTYGLGKII